MGICSESRIIAKLLNSSPRISGKPGSDDRQAHPAGRQAGGAPAQPSTASFNTFMERIFDFVSLCQQALCNTRKGVKTSLPQEDSYPGHGNVTKKKDRRAARG